MDNERRRFYGSTAWRKTQAAYMEKQNYICERCGAPAQIVHHKIPLTNDNLYNSKIALDWDNLEALCRKCHAEAHKDRDYISVKGAEFDADGNLIKQQRARVTIVWGPPGSGKSTYVAEHKGDKDLILDLDYICAALIGEPSDIYRDHYHVLDVALLLRDYLYTIIERREGKWEKCFIVTSTANRYTVNALADRLDAEIVNMGTSLDECIRRIQADNRRGNKKGKFVAITRRWFEKNPPDLQNHSTSPDCARVSSENPSAGFHIRGG